MTTEKAVAILKKHAAIYGDSKYEPAHWVVDAMLEAAEWGAGTSGCDPLAKKPQDRLKP